MLVAIGAEGSSYAMLRYLVERLPFMVCPKWVKSLAQPISVVDVVAYLAKCAKHHNKTAGQIFEIGGPDILSYEELMRTYAKYLGKSIKIIQIPILTTRLSSYWVDLVTPVKASLARPLVESLVHNTIVSDNSITKIIPLKLQTVTEAIDSATKEMSQKNQIKKSDGEKTDYLTNQRVLMILLPILGLIGTSYYWPYMSPEIHNIILVLASIVWCAGVVFAIRFVHVKTRLGYLLAGILSWMALGFWIFDSAYCILDVSIICKEYISDITVIRNIIGIATAIACVAASHNAFHKIRRYQHRGTPIIVQK